MNDILVPICDERDATWAATQAIALYRSAPSPVHLLNVQRPLPKHVAQFVDRRDLREFHDEAGMRVLEPAKRLLDEAGVPHEDHVLVGHPAETIVRFAEEHGCRQVVVDAPAEGALAKLGLGSIGSQVQHLMHAHGRDTAAPSSVSSVR
ncbi:MAG TPA: universal stress protein [Casimicrobiaceae bacterium]|nr:universal stress protein [Casimicrobiaceae bacterium]